MAVRVGLPLAAIGEQLGRRAQAARLFFYPIQQRLADCAFPSKPHERDEFLRFEELLSRYFDEEMTATDAIELVTALAEPALAARFLAMTRLNSEIAGLLSVPLPDTAMAELIWADIVKSLAAARPSTGVDLRLAERTQPISAKQPTGPAARRTLSRKRPVSRALASAAVFLDSLRDRRYFGYETAIQCDMQFERVTS